MIRLISVLLLAALIVLIPQSAYASDLVEDGYTYHDGYWYYHDNAYTRSYVQPTNGYWYNGYLYPGVAGHYNYVYHHAQSDYSAPVKGYEDPNWKSGLIDLAKARDKVELEIRKKAQDQKEYLEAIKALGLNFGPIQGYGQNIPYGSPGYGSSGYGNPNLGSFGANGQTQYGYSYEQVRQQYGDTNLMSLYQASIRLAQQSQANGQQATSETNGLIQSAGDAGARIAEIGARASAAATVFKATEPQTSTKTVTRITRNGSYSSVQSDDGPNSPGNRLAVRAILNARCATCHGGQKNRGGFSIVGYDPSDLAQKKRVIDYISSSVDDDRHCPKDSQGHGLALPEDELAILIK